MKKQIKISATQLIKDMVNTECNIEIIDVGTNIFRDENGNLDFMLEVNYKEEIKMTDKERLGLKIRKARETAGKTQKEFEKMLHKAHGTIKAYEEGSVDIPILDLIAIEMLFDIDLKEEIEDAKAEGRALIAGRNRRTKKEIQMKL